MINGIIHSGQEIVTNGLVLHLDAAQLRSYPTTGTAWSDLSGNGNTGTLTNGPTFSSANGGSIVFDGTNDYGTIANQGVVTDNITIEVAVRVTDLLSWPYNGGIFGLVSNTGYFRECWVNVSQPQGVLTNTYKVNFGNLAGNSGNGIEFGTFPSTSVVYLTYTQTGTSGQTYAYGSLVNSASVTKYTRPASNNLSVAFGWVDNDANYGHYRGNIYFFRVYNRALSAAEVLQNFNATKSRFGL